MPYTFRMCFRGLCGFVPSAPVKNRQKWVGVFLVKADPGLREGHDIDLKSHFAFLRYKMGNIDGQQNSPDGDVLLRLVNEDVIVDRQDRADRGVKIVTGRAGRIPKKEQGAGVLYKDSFAPELSAQKKRCQESARAFTASWSSFQVIGVSGLSLRLRK